VAALGRFALSFSSAFAFAFIFGFGLVVLWTPLAQGGWGGFKPRAMDVCVLRMLIMDGLKKVVVTDGGKRWCKMDGG
jgi:uncharacterized membrane protein